MRQRRRGLLVSTALAGAMLALTSCSDPWPDNMDPSDWYATSVGEEPAPESDQPVPGGDEDYPNLASVPDAPENVSTPEEIDQVAQALSADLANAQYSGTIQRVDDETAPAAMPEPEPVMVEEIEVIEPGGEIDIVAALPTTMPDQGGDDEEIVEVETETVEIVSSSGIQSETLVVAEEAPAAMPEMDRETVDTRVESETIRDESGELVGTVTRVVETTAVTTGGAAAVGASVEPETTVMVEEEQVVMDGNGTVVVEETMMDEGEAVTVAAVPSASSTTVVATPSASDATVIDGVGADEVLNVTPTAGSSSGSLVALSELGEDQVSEVVVVPEYVATLEAGEVVEAADGMAAAAAVDVPAVQSVSETVVASGGAVEMSQPTSISTRVEESTVVDNQTGDLVGSVTRTVEISEHTVPAGTTTTVEVVETAMAEDEPAAIIVPSAPAATTTTTTGTATASTQAAAAAPATTGHQGAEALDFAALMAASGPSAGTTGQPVVISATEAGTSADVAFTTTGQPLSETLAAIIRFGDGSSALGAREREIAGQLAAIHAERGGKIRLVGHASRSGQETQNQEMANFAISLDRATAVAEELMRFGVPRGDIMIEAAGDTVASAGDMAQDRRVDVFFGT